jgi:hypothetical protein
MFPLCQTKILASSRLPPGGEKPEGQDSLMADSVGIEDNVVVVIIRSGKQYAGKMGSDGLPFWLFPPQLS